MYNYILNVSGISLSDKIEERIILALYHAHLYLSESDNEQDNKSTAANTFDIS